MFSKVCAADKVTGFHFLQRNIPAAAGICCIGAAGRKTAAGSRVHRACQFAAHDLGGKLFGLQAGDGHSIQQTLGIGVERIFEQILGLGISLPGIVDPVQKMITYSHALGVRDLLFSEIQSYFPWHCTFLNDANAGAFAEGIGSDLPSSFFYLSLSNTVGGAIFHDGNLLPGDAFRCGEAGHMTLIPDGKPCYCGKTGCVDAYCSARLLSDLSGGRLEDFFLGLQQNNPDYRSVWDTYLKHLAVVINNLHMILDYDIVLGGYVGSFLSPWLDTIRRLVAEHNTFEDDGSFVKLCTYQTGAAAYGAAMDVMEEFLRTV